MVRVHGWSCSSHLYYHCLSLVLLTMVSSCLKVKKCLQFNTTVALILLFEQRSLCQEADWRDSCSQFTMMEGAGCWINILAEQMLVLPKILKIVTRALTGANAHPTLIGQWRYSCSQQKVYFSFWLEGNKDGAVIRALTSHQCGLGSNPGVDTICGLSLLFALSLLREVYLRVLWFSLLLKNEHFQIPIQREMVDEEEL